MPLNTLIEDPKEIRLNDQNEIDHILGNPPSWMLNWGMTLVLVATLLFGVLAWLIKYPDVIPAKVQILTENPAIRVMPLASGKLVELPVINQQEVAEGDLLAELDNPISKTTILELGTILAQISQMEKPNQFAALQLPEHLELGNLQSGYASLVQQLESYQYFWQQTGVANKIKTLESQIQHTLLLNKNLKKQQQTLAKEVKIVQKNYQRNQKLNQEGIVSDVELEQIETNYLQYQRQLDNFGSQMINNQVQIEQLQAQIIDLQQNRAEEQNAKIISLKEVVQNLMAQIAIWKQTFLVTAPISGKVNFNKIWGKNQFVTSSEALLTIVPSEGTGSIIGRALLPVANSGKVKIGQTVHIDLNGFPYQEFGIIKSEVKQIALVPEEEFYVLEIALPDTLVTTYNKIIPFAQEMEGTAKIITEDRRILERIFDRFFDILKNT